MATRIIAAKSINNINLLNSTLYKDYQNNKSILQLYARILSAYTKAFIKPCLISYKIYLGLEEKQVPHKQKMGDLYAGNKTKQSYNQQLQAQMP